MTDYGVLVATDGSAGSDAAVQWAAREAAIRNLPVTLLHVIVPIVVSWPIRHLENGYQRWQEDHAKLVVDLARIVAESVTDGSGGKVQAEVRLGGVAAELITASKKAAITVVGARGLGTAGAGPLGSVCRTVLHYARSPVAVVHADARTDGSAPVLLGIDGSPASEAATALAFDEAARRGADLVALHAWSDVSTAPPCGPEWRSLYEEEGGEILSERLSGYREQYPDVDVRRLVLCDRPAHWLIEKAVAAQLVVLGRRGRGGFARLLLGSVSSAVAESSPAPVVVVPATARH